VALLRLFAYGTLAEYRASAAGRAWPLLGFRVQGSGFRVNGLGFSV